MLGSVARILRNRASCKAFSLASLVTTKWHQPRTPGRRWFTEKQYEPRYPPSVLPLEKILLDGIKATGPISFATYMQTCLTFPGLGYYTNPENSVFGARGDFITSPEISQVFGELVGIWFLQQWMAAGKPQAIRLVELGPGRGTLMDDILRVISRIALKTADGQGGVQLKEINLMEASPAMRDIQESKLRDFASKVGCELNWHDTISSIKRSDAFTMVVAHEFFDALPFYQLQKTEDGWREVMVASALDPIKDPRLNRPTETDVPPPPPVTPGPNDPLFQRVLSPSSNAMSRSVLNLSPHLAEAAAILPAGSFLEISVESYLHAAALSQLIGRPKLPEASAVDANVDKAEAPSGGGCGLIIDYGGDQAYEDSFRAFKDHKIVDVFHKPGKTDLTANVDFALIKQAMGAQVDQHGPVTQSEFLQKMGMSLRVNALARQAENEERRNAIVDAAERLVDPAGMGKEYKVYGFSNLKESPPVYPFDVAAS